MVVLAWIALQYANVAALAYRLSDTLQADMGGRLVIWRESWPIARDFIRTGVGIGAFERAMLVYQQSSRLLFFNHAHNEYLQVLAEGGLLVTVPVGCAVVVGVRAAWHRLSSDKTPIFWVRAGALGGMVAVAVQNVWDTGLRMPANAALFAIVAAMALHADRRIVPAVERSGRS
jgi:O-antigen ligase